MKVFLSHIAEEGPLAAAMKTALQEAAEGVEAFVSGVDIPLGRAWLDALGAAFDEAGAVLVLCSPRSITRPWVNFESGGGWGRGRPVIPICHGGLTKKDLPHPFGMFQALTLARGRHGSEDLIRKVVAALECPIKAGADVTSIARTLSAVADAEPALGAQVGIVRTAGQARWPQGNYGSIFDLLHGSLPDRLGWDAPFAFIDDSEQLRRDRICEFRGLVIGSPWRDRFDADTIEAVRQFVSAGGRVVLLGFELGDRHHNGNLSELARHFGIEPVTDIVGPAPDGHTAKTLEKPWYVPVDFTVAAATPDPHPFTRDLQVVRLANVQTLRVEPGGIEWLRVGSNAVFRPRRDKTVYASDGTLTAGKQDFEPNVAAHWCAVAVQAPPSLCGRGEVVAIGTWDLLGDRGAFLANPDNTTLVKRILNWVSGTS